MCGRFTLATSADEIADLFDVGDVPDLRPRYNIAPTQDVPVCRVHEGARGVAELRWGLVPFWADDEKIGNRMINARGETVSEKPAFRAAFKYRRCLIPADGFYEWKKEDDGKQPYRIRRRDGAPFAFAGLWEQWSDEDNQKLETFTIITCEAADWVRDLHSRMPVILEPDHFELWLDHDRVEYAALDELLVPYDREDLMTYEAVSRDVNSPSNDRSELIEPIER